MLNLRHQLAYPHAIEVENGSVVVLDKEHPKVVGKVQSGYLVMDGKYIIDGKVQLFEIVLKCNKMVLYLL